MKVVINREALLESLGHVHSIVASKPPQEILSSVLMHADQGRIVFTTTDYDTCILSEATAEILRPGTSTLPVKRFFALCRDLPSHDIEMEIDERHIATIRSGTASFKLHGQPASDFPAIPVLEETHQFALDQGEFRSMLRQTAYAASTDETRSNLNGSLISFRDEKLTVVCTDGRRMVLVEKEVEFPSSEEIDMIVPSKVTAELIRLLGDEGPLKISHFEGKAAFHFGPVRVHCKLVEGKFPNYRQVIPSSCEERIPIEREALLAAVKRGSFLVLDMHSSVKLAFTKNRLDVSTTAQEVGEALDRVAIKYGGKDITVSFNPGFLIDALKVLPYDMVYLELTDELSPGVLKSDGAFLYVIMPMRVAG
jgi:DNA polymerase III subunit beta